MTNEFKRKTWTPAGSWLGRQLATGEVVDAEALVTAAATAGITREVIDGRLSFLGTARKASG